MERRSDSHKGENGKVAVIGGSSHIHGAPLLSALAAEASGVDLLFVCVPSCHEETAKMTSLNFQVHDFAEDELSHKDVGVLLELLATMDCAVLGPGIGRSEDSINALLEIIAGAPCALVLDATALQQQTLRLASGKKTVLTPHHGELERMGIAPKDIGATAKKHNVTILLKGETDRIASPDGKVEEVKGGNAGLTVGGTGDALAGLIAGLIAQKMDVRDACVTASRTIKRAGTLLKPTHGFSYTTRDVIAQIPALLAADG